MKEEILKLYQEGKPYKEIREIVKCSDHTIWRIVYNSDIPKRGSGAFKLKENPLSSFSREALYWLGYLAADGTINIENRAYAFVLYCKDKVILEKYNKFMLNQGKIKIWNKQGVYGCYINSKEICLWLKNKCGIGPNKALVLNPLIDITWDFIRGYFDGDGSIRLQGVHCESKFTTGSLAWANKISEFLNKNSIYNMIKQKENAYDVNIYRKEEVRKLFELMYKDAEVYTQYKYDRFKEFF